MSAQQPDLKTEEALSKVLDSLDKRIDSYSSLRVKLFNHTEKYKTDFVEAPGAKHLTALSAAAILGGIASIPMGGAPAFLMAGLALGAAGMSGMTANYILNRIANPILKHFVKTGFNPDKEIEKVVQVMNETMQANKNMSYADRSKVLGELSTSLHNKASKNLGHESLYGFDYFDETSEKAMLALKEKLQNLKSEYAHNNFDPLERPKAVNAEQGEKVNQASLMSRWIAKLSPGKEQSVEENERRPVMKR